MTGATWHLTPRQSVERESERRGRDAVVEGCLRLVAGEEVDADLLLALGGPAAVAQIRDPDRADGYWRRVWGMRGLLWCWDDDATSAVRLGARDEHWRVREMAAKVVARHHVGGALDEVAALRTDQVARVRTAAERAVAALSRADT